MGTILFDYWGVILSAIMVIAVIVMFIFIFLKKKGTENQEENAETINYDEEKGNFKKILKDFKSLYNNTAEEKPDKIDHAAISRESNDLLQNSVSKFSKCTATQSQNFNSKADSSSHSEDFSAESTSSISVSSSHFKSSIAESN
jgi:hypothetical protein